MILAAGGVCQPDATAIPNKQCNALASLVDLRLLLSPLTLSSNLLNCALLTPLGYRSLTLRRISEPKLGRSHQHIDCPFGRRAVQMPGEGTMLIHTKDVHGGSLELPPSLKYDTLLRFEFDYDLFSGVSMSTTTPTPFNDIIKSSAVRINLRATNMHYAIAELIEALVEEKLIAESVREQVTQAVLKREMSASTAMPDGIALPHGRSDVIDHLICAIGTSEGFDGGAPDGLPTRIVLLLLVPSKVGCDHIHFLARISPKLLVAETYEKVLAATQPQDIRDALIQA